MAETISSWLRRAEDTLLAAGVETARLDALVLLCDEVEKDKSWVFTYPEYELQGSVIENLNTKIVQRATHIPLAYLRGHAEFYGRDFIVDENVLVPRPESEDMIDLLKRTVHVERRASIWDVGTGSGCLAITARLELPSLTVYGSDISETALEIAKQNATAHSADIVFVQADLLHADVRYTNSDDLYILANLPYVPDDYGINAAAAHEPALALFSGPDGLDHYRRLFTQCAHLPKKPVCVITESLDIQHKQLTQLAVEAGYSLAYEQNLVQCFTV